MRNRILVFTFFLFSFTTAFSQPADTSFVSNFEVVLEERFEGGFQGFLRHFYQLVKYPQAARSNCRTGQLLVAVKISSDGAIQGVSFLNKLGFGIEEEVERVIKTSAGKWKTATNEADLFFSIAFIMEGVAELNGDMKIIAYGGGTSGGVCESTQDIETKMDNALKKGKKDKAMEYCEELLRRYPFSSLYIKAYSELKGTK
ncbi:MAG: energy transducer TonB [Saprospiraceae bacterium]|nr:energy transducer TonB [Saprospiraceae bacterium]